MFLKSRFRKLQIQTSPDGNENNKAALFAALLL